MLIFFVILVVAIVVLLGITITGNVTEEDQTSQTKETSLEEEKANYKEEKKEREWTDANEQVKFVIQGGKVQCPFCSPPMADIIVTSSTIMMQDKPWASVKDKDGKVNFNFTGLCTHPSQQKPSAPPPPCKSVISLGEWKDYSDTMIGDNNALLVKSTIPCNISGQDLKIIDSGQKATLEEVKPKVKKEPKIITGYWTDINDKILLKAILGETVRFHIETQDILDGETIDIVICDDDSIFGKDDEIAKTKIIIKGNKGYVEINLAESWISYIEDDRGNEIELYCKCKCKNQTKKLPNNSDDYLIVYEIGEIVTVIVELPHSTETDKLNAKGLAGHTGIIIDNDFYDFGPQPGKPFKSDGRPWWDKFGGDLNKQDILDILNTNRVSYRIFGKVYLIDICIKKDEFVKLKEWWVNRYANLGTYSVIPLIGQQCTTTVRISLEKSTGIFSFFDFSNMTQTPKGFVELLTTKAKHTAGKNANTTVAITQTFVEL